MTLTGDNEKPRVDSRVMAKYLDIKHNNVREMIQRRAADFRERGVLTFETEKPTEAEGGRPEKVKHPPAKTGNVFLDEIQDLIPRQR